MLHFAMFEGYNTKQLAITGKGLMYRPRGGRLRGDLLRGPPLQMRHPHMRTGAAPPPGETCIVQV